MRWLWSLSLREVWRLVPLRRRVRNGALGSAVDGLNGELGFLRWRRQHGEMDEHELDDETAARLRADIMRRVKEIGRDAEV